jgi:hypothetical protein
MGGMDGMGGFIPMDQEIDAKYFKTFNDRDDPKFIFSIDPKFISNDFDSMYNTVSYTMEFDYM